MSGAGELSPWRRLEPTEAAALLAIAEEPGWVDSGSLDAAAALEAHLARLRTEIANTEEMIAAAREQGRHEGHRAGCGELAELAQSVRQAANRLEQRAAVVALAVAEALLHAEVAAAPDLLVERVRALLRDQAAPIVRLRVAPTIATALGAHRDLVYAIAPDPSLQPGDVVVELANGQVDARVQVALALLEPDVVAALGELPGMADLVDDTRGRRAKGAAEPDALANARAEPRNG